jgi:uncharacterized protein
MNAKGRVMTDTIRILSIDGGGIRGIIPAMVIQALLGERKAQDVFHIIAGTSTGGIIACGLAKPNPIDIQDVIELYVKHGGEIFRKCLLQPIHYLYDPKYRPNALEQYLTEKFGGTYLSDVSDVELLVPSYAISLPVENPPGNTCAPMFFRSWQARGRQLADPTKRGAHDFKLAAVGRATSAAPTYFPPAQIENRAGQSFAMIDGGVFANNPALCAIVEAIHLYHSRKLLVVSIGTGSEPVRIDAAAARHWGEISWAVPMMSIFMTGSAQTVAFETHEFLGPRDHWRFDISLATKTPQGETVDGAMDDASPANIKALVDKAKQLITTEQNKIAALAKILAEPKAVVAPKDQPPPKGFLLSAESGGVS